MPTDCIVNTKVAATLYPQDEQIVFYRYTLIKQSSDCYKGQYDFKDLDNRDKDN